MSIQKKRRWTQVLSALAVNAYIPTLIKGKIYQGKIKGICVPVLNCYSCPSALGACPIGSIQNFMASLKFNLSLPQYQLGLYVLGSLGVVGSLLGRIPCGWLCPFGFIQDVLHKIPSPKLSIPKFLKWTKYIVLAVMVVALPLLLLDEYGMGKTWFCAWICPAGTLEAGIPLVSLNPGLRSQIGFMFSWKVGVLIFFLAWMIFSERPFCRTACPLGAILGLFNKGSLFRLVVDEARCKTCGACSKNCPVRINVHESPNSPECIRCLKCVESCPRDAVGYDFPFLNRSSRKKFRRAAISSTTHEERRPA